MRKQAVKSGTIQYQPLGNDAYTYRLAALSHLGLNVDSTRLNIWTLTTNVEVAVLPIERIPLVNRPCEANLRGELDALFGGSRAANDCILTVKVLGNLFQWRVPSLNVEEVDDDQFERQPDAVKDIILPTEIVEGNGIDVLVEEDWLGVSADRDTRMRGPKYSRARSTESQTMVMPLARML